MILRPQQIHLLRMTGRRHLANMGGGGGSTSSQQSTDTSTQLTNNVTSTDSRAVASNGAIALGGAGASAMLTNNNTTSNKNDFTSLDHSGNVNTDSGNSSTSFSSSTTNTVTDFGSVQAALNGMKATAHEAIGLSGDVAGDAIGALTHQSDNSMNLIGDLFNFASASSANSQSTAMHALGLADNTTADATKAASDDKKHLTYALLAGGVMVAILILKK